MINFKYYNHALIPSDDPKHREAAPLVDKRALFSKHRKAWMIRYTTDFDMATETQWWYCIKDTSFDIQSLKSKRRNVVQKGVKNFDVKVIAPTKHVAGFLEILNDAFSEYEEKRTFSREEVEEKCRILESSEAYIVFGAFSRSNPEALCGYLWCERSGSCISLVEQHVTVAAEHLSVNAALVQYCCAFFDEDIKAGAYLSDGERTMWHASGFQNYLEKYFGFRKAYCRLHVSYRFPFGVAIALCWPLRKIWIKLFGNNAIGRRICAIMELEEIRRSFR